MNPSPSAPPSRFSAEQPRGSLEEDAAIPRKGFMRLVESIEGVSDQRRKEVRRYRRRKVGLLNAVERLSHVAEQRRSPKANGIKFFPEENAPELRKAAR